MTEAALALAGTALLISVATSACALRFIHKLLLRIEDLEDDR